MHIKIYEYLHTITQVGTYWEIKCIIKCTSIIHEFLDYLILFVKTKPSVF